MPARTTPSSASTTIVPPVSLLSETMSSKNSRASASRRSNRRYNPWADNPRPAALGVTVLARSFIHNSLIESGWPYRLDPGSYTRAPFYEARGHGPAPAELAGYPGDVYVDLDTLQVFLRSTAEGPWAIIPPTGSVPHPLVKDRFLWPVSTGLSWLCVRTVKDKGGHDVTVDDDTGGFNFQADLEKTFDALFSALSEKRSGEALASTRLSKRPRLIRSASVSQSCLTFDQSGVPQILKLQASLRNVADGLSSLINKINAAENSKPAREQTTSEALRFEEANRKLLKDAEAHDNLNEGVQQEVDSSEKQVRPYKNHLKYYELEAMAEELENRLAEEKEKTKKLRETLRATIGDD
ncbi:hypothetical protein FISHEDRAFT_76902 [Fistulina hepatica ATCC 64428]|uniref:Uncharacterized protein n=1 Tax=Fistulina hepatica ATCC 64428 TaxID=1128425 RepID=A0A0D7A2U0_9AGAR|nr:hypothetical protein FISHEDRAFT_76902 [Fistulina hepatica ATCC 64428]